MTFTKDTARMAINKRWTKKLGMRFTMSVFPVKGGKHRVTISFEGKEQVMAGPNRLKLMEEGFKWMVERTKQLT